MPNQKSKILYGMYKNRHFTPNFEQFIEIIPFQCYMKHILIY